MQDMFYPLVLFSVYWDCHERVRQGEADTGKTHVRVKTASTLNTHLLH